MAKTNLIIIGVGPHSKRIYLPTLTKHAKKLGINLKLGIDLKEKRRDIETFLENQQIPLEMLYIDPFDPLLGIPKSLKSYLNTYIAHENIHGVVIATEPLAHKCYAVWALQNKLHILMDKPISTRKNTVKEMAQAEAIYTDYLEMLDIYASFQRETPTVFSVNVQRRYHAGHRLVMRLIKEVAERFDAPVTSVQSMHADGQWRLPGEIVTQIYHPYCQGYGKCSHSGYHIFDIAYQYYKAGKCPGKFADRCEVMTSFVQPRGFIKQFNEKNYEQYFGKDYSDVKNWNDKELYEMYKNYGEVDAFSLFRFIKGKDAICNISINLLHNSFARRTWVYPGKDLYKGNGRVKHQYHSIQQGPFQNVQIHNFQAIDKHDVAGGDDYELGGRNHFEIHVYRNSGMFGKKEKPLRVYSIQDVDGSEFYPASDLTHETAKEFVVVEFLKAIRGDVSRKNLRSSIASHAVPVKMMSAVYKSHICQSRGLSPLVPFSIDDEK